MEDSGHVIPPECTLEKKGSYLLLRCASQNSLDESSQKHDNQVAGREKPPYRNHRHTHRAFDALNVMRKQSQMCDIVLVSNSVEIPAHKTLLAACSVYFYERFTNGDDQGVGRLDVCDVEPQALKLLVDYIYSSEVQVTEDNVQILLPAAKLLQLKDVTDACCEFLQAQLHPTNCLGIRAFADLHGCTELLQWAETYAEQHFMEVVECEEFLTLSSQQVLKLVSSDRLTVSSEEKVFECVVSWVKHDLDERKQYLSTLMEHVRFPLLSHEFLVQRVRVEPLMESNIQCKDFLVQALIFQLLEAKGDKDITYEIQKATPRQPVGLPKVLLVAGGQAPKAIRGVECFDFKEQRWYQVSEMPNRRCRAGLAAVAGKVFAVGGFNGSLRVRTVDAYDVVSDSWTSCPSMEARRSTLGVAVLRDCIYAVGGFDGSNGLSSAEMYDPRTQEWHAIASMGTMRSSVGVGVMKDILYAVGGYDGASRQCLSSVEAYDPDSDTWTPITPMSVRRSGAGVGVLNGLLYAVGGHEGPNVRSSVEAYNPETELWTPVADMAMCRRNAGVVAFNGRLYAVGGDNGSSNLSSVEVYDPETNAWTLLPFEMSIGRSYAGVCVLDKPL
ncbi:ring canal kelch homolog [Ischnura elegans]|uniref:ring canal kelch homolog n=1 Tax=Ischnura elegans TaxID=197161 RepID=UPI001ED871FC|nr:ring canal kelch homolog [Ischnura elegans]